MGTRVSYPVEVKMKAIEMRLAKVPVKEVMEILSTRNKTQLKRWMHWYRMEKSTVSINQLVNNIPSVKDRNMAVCQTAGGELVFETAD